MTEFTLLRDRMVAEQIEPRGVSDPRVLQAMRQVPRERFVDPDYADHAYEDRPLPIAEGQTISQPFIVALMAQAAQIKPTDRVLEIGSGSGYGAAVLSELAMRVWSDCGRAAGGLRAPHGLGLGVVCCGPICPITAS